MSGWWSDVSHRLAAKTLVFLVLVVALYWNQERGIRHLTNQTHTALCAFKGDLDRRVELTQVYLDANDDRYPIPGLEVPRDDIAVQLANQRRTLASLKILEC